MNTERVGHFLHGSLDRASDVASRLASLASRAPRVVLATITGAAVPLLGSGVETSAQTQPQQTVLQLFSNCVNNQEPHDPNFPDWYLQLYGGFSGVPGSLGSTAVIRHIGTGEIFPVYSESPRAGNIDGIFAFRHFLGNRDPDTSPTIREGSAYALEVYLGLILRLGQLGLDMAPNYAIGVRTPLCPDLSTPVPIES